MSIHCIESAALTFPSVRTSLSSFGGANFLRKGFDGSLLHLRDVYVLLLSELRRAGVFAGLIPKTTEPHEPTRQKASGFLVLSGICVRMQRNRKEGDFDERYSREPYPAHPRSCA